MSERNVSSLLIIDDGKLTGILTDRDLRRRVLAAGHGPELIIGDVMTPDPVTVDPSMLAFEAMLLMAERSYHHLPVADETGVVGMVVIGDLLRTLHTDPVYATATLARKARSPRSPRSPPTRGASSAASSSAACPPTRSPACSPSPPTPSPAAC